MALSLVGACDVLADIGTDHARLPIAAIQRNLITHAIACDVAPGPLAAASENIYKAGMLDRIQTRLGNGFDPLRAGEADVAVIAGMGGMNIVNILERGAATAKACRRLVLQPQRDIPALRMQLHRTGYAIINERLAREGERFYVLLVAEPVDAAMQNAEHSTAGLKMPCVWAPREYSIGKFLPNDPLWLDYVRTEITRMQKYIAQGAAGVQLDEYTRRLLWLCEAQDEKCDM